MSTPDNIMSNALENGIAASFDANVVVTFARRIKNLVSQRGDNTYIFPWKDVEGYSSLIRDRKRFHAEVIEKLCEHGHLTGHKSRCRGQQGYTLCGYRENPRKTVMSSGKKETFPIRMAQCRGCGQKFSLLPSFLPREKNFGIDIIGNVCRNLQR